MAAKHDQAPVIEKTLTIRQCLSRLMVWLRPNRKKLFAGIFMVVIANLTYIVMPVTEGRITTQLQRDLTDMSQGLPGAHIQMDVIVGILGMLLGIYLIKITSQFLSTFWMTDAIQKTMADIRLAIEKKINALPVSYFDTHKTGDLLSRITTDVTTVSNALQQTLSRIIGAVLGVSLIAVMMFTINRVMFAIVMIGLPLIAAISIVVVRLSQPVFDSRKKPWRILTAPSTRCIPDLAKS